MGSTVFRSDRGTGPEPLVTLRDAAQYIIKLPKAEHDAVEWQAAMPGGGISERSARARMSASKVVIDHI